MSEKTQELAQRIAAVSEWIDSNVHMHGGGPEIAPEPASQFDWDMCQAAGELRLIADALSHLSDAQKKEGAPGDSDAERAAWLGDKIAALGDYAREASAMLQRWPTPPAAAEAPAVPSDAQIVEALRNEMKLYDEGATVADKATLIRAVRAALATPTDSAVNAGAVPFDAIVRILDDAMNAAVANGANSVSMPDYMVEVAAWLAAPKADSSEPRADHPDCAERCQRPEVKAASGAEKTVQTKLYKDGIVATGNAPLPEASPMQNDDEFCPRCGSEEWDRIIDKSSPGASINRCSRCENEWAPMDICALPKWDEVFEKAECSGRESLNTVEIFILDNEPADREEEASFRKQLVAELSSSAAQAQLIPCSVCGDMEVTTHCVGCGAVRTTGK